MNGSKTNGVRRAKSSLKDKSWLQRFVTEISQNFKVSEFESPVRTDKITSVAYYVREGQRAEITDDVDFDPDDYDGRIKRYEERIRQGYPSKVYEAKIEILKAHQGTMKGLQVQYPGKSWEVIQRIGSLKVIAAHLEGIEDPLGELPNVNAIIHAYENGQLEWDDNASYWCQGKLIAGTSPFSWSDFRTLNTKENRGGGGFWVEGVFPLAPSEKAMRWESPTRNAVGTPEVRIGLRLDRTAREMELSQTDYTGMPFPVLLRRFIDDSAADFMTIGEVDMWELMGNEIEVATAPMGHLMGYSTIALADGRVAVMKILSVEVNMVGFDELRRPGLMLPDWTTIPCAVFETLRPWYHHMLLDGAGRLAGPWLRSKFYVGSAPEAPYPSLYAGSDVHDLFSMLPILPPGNRPGPLFRPPHMGVNWAVQPETGLFVPAPSIGGYRAVPPGTLQG